MKINSFFNSVPSSLRQTYIETFLYQWILFIIKVCLRLLPLSNNLRNERIGISITSFKSSSSLILFSRIHKINNCLRHLVTSRSQISIIPRNIYITNESINSSHQNLLISWLEPILTWVKWNLLNLTSQIIY